MRNLFRTSQSRTAVREREREREREYLFTNKERRKLIYNFFLRWSKGGSREHYGIALLPRDLV